MSRKHLAHRWYDTGKTQWLTIKCSAQDCGYTSTGLPVGEQEELFRQHRRDMGEKVAPARPTPKQQLQTLLDTMSRITEQAEMWHRGELDSATAMCGVMGETRGMGLPDARIEAQAFLDLVVRMVRRKVNPEHPDCAVCAIAANIADDIEYMRREAGQHCDESVQRLAQELAGVDRLVSHDTLAATRLRKAVEVGHTPYSTVRDCRVYQEGMEAALAAYEGREAL